MNKLIDSTLGATIATATLSILAVGGIFSAPNLIWNAVQMVVTV